MKRLVTTGEIVDAMEALGLLPPTSVEQGLQWHEIANLPVILGAERPRAIFLGVGAYGREEIRFGCFDTQAMPHFEGNGKFRPLWWAIWEGTPTLPSTQPVDPDQ